MIAVGVLFCSLAGRGLRAFFSWALVGFLVTFDALGFAAFDEDDLFVAAAEDGTLGIYTDTLGVDGFGDEDAREADDASLGLANFRGRPFLTTLTGALLVALAAEAEEVFFFAFVFAFDDFCVLPPAVAAATFFPCFDEDDLDLSSILSTTVSNRNSYVCPSILSNTNQLLYLRVLMVNKLRLVVLQLDPVLMLSSTPSLRQTESMLG